MHALIIEPDPWIALMIEDVLRELGYASFDFAESGGEAVALAARTCPDLVTSDVDGGAVIAAVRELCAGRRIPAVFVTDASAAVHAHHQGLTAVRKPFTCGALKAGIADAVAAAPTLRW